MKKVALASNDPTVVNELSRTAETLPIAYAINDLFVDPEMFESFDKFSSEGFRLIDHAENKIMSGSHKKAPGYLFKKYNNDKSNKDQLRNYMRRIEGAQLLKAFIAERHFKHVTVPQKWLCELQPSFPAPHLLVAEKLDIVPKEETERYYSDIDEEQLRELATVLYYFRGLNSTAANLPFTEDGKIAFIDTERWHKDKDYLRKVGDRLSKDRRRMAEDIYNELREQRERPLESAFK